MLLPFGEIPWEHFEALSLELFERRTGLADTRLYAGRGERQGGIDLYGVTPAGEYETAQCRRVRELTAGDIESVVDDFVAGPWAERSSGLTLFTAATTEARAVAETIETQRERLTSLDVAFAVRDRRELSRSLRTDSDLVDAYFGPGIRRAFCTGEDHVSARAEGAIETAELVVAAARRPRIVDLGSLHVAVQKAVRELVA
jgi:hypothetical protein